MALAEVGRFEQALDLQQTDRVLEVGAGSGYAAAVMAELAGQVTAIEYVEPLAKMAAEHLAVYGDRVSVVHGDGSLGHTAGAPYDAISVAAAARSIPRPLPNGESSTVR